MVLAVGETRTVGWNALPIVGSLPGLKKGTIFVTFQVCGIMLLFMKLLNKCVKYLIVVRPRFSDDLCFYCRGL